MYSYCLRAARESEGRRGRSARRTAGGIDREVESKTVSIRLRLLRCVQVRGEAVQFVLDAFKDDVFAIATHPFGCRIVQRVLEYCSPAQMEPVLAEVLRSAADLMRDQYGNYVIQHIVEHGTTEQRSAIIRHFVGNILACAQHKFASNVVERCLEYGLPSERELLIQEAITADEAGVTPLHSMMKDQYANYVVQKMLALATPPQRARMVVLLRENAPTLKRFPYGRHILARLERMGEKVA